ncbi:WDR92 [Bugula neritina]|uniref:WDR92 n=1 Tax=Bugula neritina TaxID=10212 RepID=A0A7J7JUN3_BUGNE|nr:WDR92 [Bugula neritina]
MDKPQIILHAHKSLNFTLFDSKWIPTSAKFVVIGNQPKGSGTIQIYEVSHGDVDLVKQIDKGVSLKCCTFAASSLQQRYLATGDFEGKVSIWNLEEPALPVYSAKGHKEIINAIDGVGGLGIGEGHAFNVHDRCVAAGYDNGDIKLFDLRKMALRWEHNLHNGVVGIEFDRKDIDMNKMVATTLESKFYVYDMRTQHPTKGFTSLSEKAHKSTIWCVKHLPQNRDIFMTTGGTGTLNLWKYNYPAKRIVKTEEGNELGVVGSLDLLQNTALSTQPISSFDWSPDKPGLCVCTAFDQTLRVLITTKLNQY